MHDSRTRQGGVATVPAHDATVSARNAPVAPDPDPAGSPLLPAVLAFVGDGSTAEEIAVRLALEIGDGSPSRIAPLLDDLARLGLARVARTDGDRPRYVITSLGQQTLALSLAHPSETAERLAELETLRTDLFATLAHELRTPLTAVRTCAGLLLDPAADEVPEGRRKLAESIRRNADRMQRLIEDLLQLTRFRAGQVQLQLRRFDACELARDLGASFGPLATSRGIRLDLELPDQPVWVYGDHRRLEQAVINLLSNAHKFSPPGGTVRFGATREGDEVRWWVVDEGPGIAPADQARLFERFFVGRNDRGELHAGTGLGLPTALAIAQAHDGRIDVRSEPGHGATFVLAVPATGPSGLEDA